MCFKKILKLFKRQNPEKTSAAGSVPAEIPVPETKPLTIPHPEEAADYSQTVENTNLSSAVEQWEEKYNVPEKFRVYWKTRIAIKLDANLSAPAVTYESQGIRQLSIRPEWVNPGVIAHEQAHNSYALLTKKQKAQFSTDYRRLKTSDSLIVFLFSRNPYGLTSDVEGHAEVYRFLCEEMPEGLKQYYPRLF
jgi:hypothetical protein